MILTYVFMNFFCDPFCSLECPKIFIAPKTQLREKFDSRNPNEWEFFWNVPEARLRQLKSNNGAWVEFTLFLSYNERKKWSNFDLKCWVISGTKIRHGILSNWRIFESNWHSISSQFDSNILQLLGIRGRILVPPVTQLFRSKWLYFFFQYIIQLMW